jgi:hypothetical protein
MLVALSELWRCTNFCRHHEAPVGSPVGTDPVLLVRTALSSLNNVHQISGVSHFLLGGIMLSLLMFAFASSLRFVCWYMLLVLGGGDMLLGVFCFVYGSTATC